ncbi:MAG: NAD(+) synthase [Bacteriovoracia bacterium]
MQILLHQTHHTVADFKAIEATLLSTIERPGLHIFPELYLTGYPLADLCLMSPFIQTYVAHLKNLHDKIAALPAAPETAALVGGLAYVLGDEGVPLRIRNVVYSVIPGQGLSELYSKRLLPNYDIFDEQKYFTPGTEACVWEWHGKRFALMICEDMWASSFHQLDPARDLEALKPFDAIFNLSASPYDVAKGDKRRDRARTLSHLLEAPFFYVNRVGGEDEVLFDGASFCVNGDDTVGLAPQFSAHTLNLTLPERGSYQRPESMLEHTWESLFAPRFSENKIFPRQLQVWTDEECASVAKALQFSLQEYAAKNGFKKFLVALSGGMDSALVLTLAKLSLRPGQELEAVYMPGAHSRSISWDYSLELCRRLGLRLTSLPIKFLHSNVRMAFQNTFAEPFEGLTDENVQSRLRGLLIYTRSNQTGAMVINTSNKSELAVGYSTQYGDSVGALSLLGDLYKTEVYRLSEWFNQHHGDLIPREIIDRSPSAELRADQVDQDSLPPYVRLDAILEGILSYRHTPRDLVSMGFEEAEVKRVFHLYANAEYKRRQFCPVTKIKAKSFGFGYRVPISKHSGFYQSQP